MLKPITMEINQVQYYLSQGKLDRVVKYLYSHKKAIFSYVRKNSGTTSDAKDVFQEGLVVFCDKASQDGFCLTSDVKTYFFSICRIVWLSELRNRKKTIVSEEEIIEEYDEEQEELFLKAEQAFLKLSDACQRLLNDFYLLKLSMDSIAQKWKMKSPKIAKDRKYKCLNKARKMFQKSL